MCDLRVLPRCATPVVDSSNDVIEALEQALKAAREHPEECTRMVLIVGDYEGMEYDIEGLDRMTDVLGFIELAKHHMLRDAANS